MIEPQRFETGMARQLERFREALTRGMPRRGWKLAIRVAHAVPSGAFSTSDQRSVRKRQPTVSTRRGTLNAAS